MINKRRSLRYPSLAHAKIPGVFNEAALLKDLSITGCHIETTSHINIQKGERYKIEIIPERTSKIHSFTLLAEARWIHSEAYSYEAGFHILESPKGKLLQRYIDYLAWRGETQ